VTIPAGERTTLVTFERGTPVGDDYTDEKSIDWNDLQLEVTVMAKVLYGTGEERRQAAQEGATQAATIMVNWTPTLAGVVAKDRATFHAVAWDIDSAPARVGLNDELHFTVRRSE
jgi:head-tail adaptor